MIRLLYTAEKRWFGVIVRKVEGSVGLCRIRVEWHHCVEVTCCMVRCRYSDWTPHLSAPCMQFPVWLRCHSVHGHLSSVVWTISQATLLTTDCPVQLHGKRPFLSWALAVSLQVTWVINPAVGCHYFPPGLQLPLQPLRGLLPILLLGEQRHDGCEQLA